MTSSCLDWLQRSSSAAGSCLRQSLSALVWQTGKCLASLLGLTWGLLLNTLAWTPVSAVCMCVVLILVRRQLVLQGPHMCRAVLWCIAPRNCRHSTGAKEHRGAAGWMEQAGTPGIAPQQVVQRPLWVVGWRVQQARHQHPVNLIPAQQQHTVSASLLCQLLQHGVRVIGQGLCLCCP